MTPRNVVWRRHGQILLSLTILGGCFAVELPIADAVALGTIDSGYGGYGGEIGRIGIGGIGGRLRSFGNGLGGVGVSRLGYGSGLGTGWLSGGFNGGAHLGDLGGYRGARIVDLDRYGGDIGFGGYGPDYGNGWNLGYGDGYGGYGGYGGGLERYGFAKGGESLGDASYQNEEGQKGLKSTRLAEGSSLGQSAVNEAKGNSGRYFDEGGSKKGQADNKEFNAARQYNEKGVEGTAGQSALGHKKGHVTNGFETSHHKDETGKTTRFFDEENDEGDHYNYGGNHGDFGDRGGTYYNGGYQDDKFNAGGHAHKGAYDRGYSNDKEDGNKMAYGNDALYATNGQFGQNGGNDRRTALGHSEVSKYYKQQPYSYYR